MTIAFFILALVYVLAGLYNTYINHVQKQNQDKILMHEKQTAKFIGNWEGAVKRMEVQINEFIMSQRK